MTSHSTLAVQEITDALLDLSDESTESGFACRLTMPSDRLSLEVSGVGKIRLPVTPNRAKSLIKIARQAPFGRRDKTLTDVSVRNAWEIAKSRVKIDNRLWNMALNPALRQISQKLGLMDGELKADLYKMLVYQPGQFFVPHRDSEKTDDMLATLVVVLPSSHSGGALVVEHQDTKKQFYSHRTASDKLALFAFYADCRHELKPVTEGYRIALTYNLSYKLGAKAARGKTARSKAARCKAARGKGAKGNDVKACQGVVNSRLQTALGQYLSDSSQVKPLVILLNHQYSDRSLRWSHLKSVDRARAQSIEAALNADRSLAGYHLNLAQLKLSEIWHATDDRFDPYERGRVFYGYDDDWDDDDDWDEELEEQDSEEHENLTLHDLIEQHTVLSNWRNREGGEVALQALSLYDAPLVACTPLNELKPASSYYEDYTGNAGNTLDRTYHRAAIVLWSDKAHVQVLADIGLNVLFRYWLKELKGKNATDYTEALNSVDLKKRLWRYADDKSVFADLLELLSISDDRELCISTIQQFRIDVLSPKLLPKFTQLARHCGIEFYSAVFRHWTSNDGRKRGWFEHTDCLQNFIEYSNSSADPSLHQAALELYDCFSKECKKAALKKTSTVVDEYDDELQERMVGKKLVAILSAGVSLGDAKRLADMQSHILKNAGNCDSADLVIVLENIGALRGTMISFYKALHKMLEKRLQIEADSHIRTAGEWRISHQIDCGCALCSQLKAFLIDPDTQRLDISAAKNKRKHLHRTIDAHRLPVSHTTTRVGSPYTLNLVKKQSLFALEKKRRNARLQLLERVRSIDI